MCEWAGSEVTMVGDPGGGQLKDPPGRVIHLGHSQAEPVPKTPEPFASGPGDRLFQAPPLDEFSRAGARHGRDTPFRSATRTFASSGAAGRGQLGLLRGGGGRVGVPWIGGL